MKMCKNYIRRGSGGRDCATKVRKTFRAFGPTHVSHFSCAISAPRPPPDTIIAQLYFLDYSHGSWGWTTTISEEPQSRSTTKSKGPKMNPQVSSKYLKANPEEQNRIHISDAMVDPHFRACCGHSVCSRLS